MPKNNLYQVFDSRFNKNDMYQKICYKLKKQKRRQKVIKYSFATISLLFVVSGLFISKNTFLNKEVTDECDELKNEIYINEINNDMYNSVFNYDIHVLNMIHSTYAVMPISINIPSDLMLDNIYLIYIKNKETEEYDIIHDIMESYIGNDRLVNVTYSSIGEVLRDIDISNGKLSIVKGIKVMISKNGKTFIGQFQYNNIYYDIETSGLTFNEFLNIIKSVLK